MYTRKAYGRPYAMRRRKLTTATLMTVLLVIALARSPLLYGGHRSDISDNSDIVNSTECGPRFPFLFIEPYATFFI